MQKKAKLQLADIIFVFVCIVGSIFSVWKFEKTYFLALTKHDTPIATITFKHKTAQRQFWEGVIWDRLRQNSDVYEGDLVRTAPSSSATVFFTDGNIMELRENTLVRLNLKKDGTNEVDFMEGNISVDSAGSAFSIKAGSSVVEIEKGGSLSAGRGEDNKAFSLQVQNGGATYFDGEGNIQIGDGNGITVDESGAIKKGVLAVNTPSMSERFVNFSSELYPVDFKWTASVDDALIELSDSKSFKEIRESYHIKGAYSTRLMLAAGIHYWRISVTTSENITEVALGRIEVLKTSSPELVAPVNNYQVNYRSKTPVIRFIWKDCPYATSYQLDISRSSDMSNVVFAKRVSSPSFFVSKLEKGTYYWRVTPYYVINNIGLKGSSDIGTFTINQSGRLEAPRLNVPQEGGIVNTRIPLSDGTKSYCKVNFSWRDCPEAQNYEILLSRDKNFSSPQISATTYDNYFIIDTQNTNIDNGKWYWKVIAKDVEGNTSPSVTGSFVAIDANAEQRTLFPVESYRLASTQSQDIRYVWKSNIPGDTVFELATDNEFTHIVHSQITVNNSINGRYLAPGTYFWRIRSNLEGVSFETPAKTLIVEPPMEAPSLMNPVDGGLAVIRPKKPFKFTWNAVEGADYYQLKIYNRNNPEDPIYNRNFIEGSPDSKTVSLEVNLENYAETEYGLSIQAFREETPKASRSSSYIGEFKFTVVKIKLISLVYPEDKVVINGVDAIKKPDVFKWKYVASLPKSSLVIYKDSIKPENLVAEIKNPSRTVEMPRLYEGNYYWTMVGFTEDEFDVSAEDFRTFSITEIEKLPEVQIVSPKERISFDKDYFKTSRKIVFEWKAMPHADRYVFTVYDKNKKPVIEKIFNKDVLKYELTDFSLLSVGNFTWTIEAQSMFEGYVFQHGKNPKHYFKINLPNLSKPKTNDDGVRYGK
ncbi:FecR domain-containing protein [Treponema sp.]|uniref:FecR domain-containing protein n=1 Tax=Treponema sp. TaxID=166 RepID=UPI00298D73F4|nr:FecR domain-containing protein [Treponema sp.]MCR5613813.1 FecR family protein [Treponema sp.]